MPEIVSDNPDIFQMPVQAANEVYANTNPGLGSALFGGGYGAGPLSELSRAAERGTQAGSSFLDRAIRGLTAGAAITGEAPGGYDPAFTGAVPAPEVTPQMQPADYNEQYAPRDINGKIIPIGDQPMSEGLARIIGEQKREALEREGVWRRFGASHGWLSGAGAGVVSTMLDPLNAALSFVPALGEGALAAQLGGGFLARAAARVGAGAAAGAAVGIPESALRMTLDPEEASDYGMREALRDTFYSAAGFAALHGGFGTAADVLRGGLRARPDQAAAAAVLGQPDAATQNAAMRSTIGQVAEGRPVDVGDFFYQPPQAETAIGQAMAPVGRPEIRAAPDVEAQARQIAPDAFARYDALRQQMADLQAEVRNPEAAVDQQISEARARAETARAETAEPLSASPDIAIPLTAEEVSAGIARGTVAYEAAAKEAETLAAQRPDLIQAHLTAAREQLVTTDTQLRDILATGELARAREQATNIQAAAAANRAVVMGPARGLPTLADIAQRERAAFREGWAPGVSRDELAAANDAVYGHPAEATPAPGTPRPDTLTEAPGSVPRETPASTRQRGTAEPAPEEAMLEQRVAQLPPEAIHPEDRAELDAANEAVAAQPTLRGAFETAANCLLGLV